MQKIFLYKFSFTRVFIPCFTHAVLFICSLWNLYPVSSIICSLFSNHFTECLRWQENALLQKKDLFCSIIMSGENTTSKKLIPLVMDPQCNCKKQEYQEFHFIMTMIYSTSIISVNVGVSLKNSFSKLVLKHFTHHLTEHI